MENAERGKRVRTEWLLRLAREFCKIRGIEYPAVVRSFPAADLIHVVCQVFRRGEIDVSDFLSEAEETRDLCGLNVEEMRGLLKNEFPSAAAAWAKRHNLAPLALTEKHLPFTNPTCNDNRKLHDLCTNVRFVFVDSKSNADFSIREIAKSQLLVAKITVRTRKYYEKEQTMLTIMTDYAMIIL